MPKDVFRMPTPMKITGRTSSITNAFVNGIIPTIEPSEEELDDVLRTLGMTRETICCAYCGDKYTEWDHFRPLIINKAPTGYVSEIHNLVPACGKCNQSKGNKNWKEWMLGDAKLSPKTRGIKDLAARIERLSNFEKKYTPLKVDFEKVVGKELWASHLENHRKLIEMMKSSQKTADDIREKVKKRYQ